MADLREELGSERMIMLLGKVASELSGERSMRPIQGAGDGPERLPAIKEHGKDLPVLFIQMRIRFHRPPFYPRNPFTPSGALAH